MRWVHLISVFVLRREVPAGETRDLNRHIKEVYNNLRGAACQRPLPSARAEACRLDAERAQLGTFRAQLLLDSGAALARPRPVPGLLGAPATRYTRALHQGLVFGLLGTGPIESDII